MACSIFKSFLKSMLNDFTFTKVQLVPSMILGQPCVWKNRQEYNLDACDEGFSFPAQLYYQEDRPIHRAKGPLLEHSFLYSSTLFLN